MKLLGVVIYIQRRAQRVRNLMSLNEMWPFISAVMFDQPVKISPNSTFGFQNKKMIF